MHAPTGSTPIRRSTTNEWPRCFTNTDSTARSIGSPLRLEEDYMRLSPCLTALVIASTATLSITAQTAGIRDVSANPRSVIPLQTKLRYTTMVVLPDDEEILDVIC